MNIKKNIIDKPKHENEKEDTKIVDRHCIGMFMALFVLGGVILSCLLVLLI